MATYEILDDTGAVTNTIVADQDFVDLVHPGKHRLVPEPEPVAVIPQSVTPLQAKVALHNAGLLDAVNAAVAAADPVTQIAWANATTFERTSPTLAALAEGLGWTQTQLDELFTAAAQITA